MNNEEKHIDIRERLLSLPKLKAKENFETTLLHKINLLGNEQPVPLRNKKAFSLFGRNFGWALPAVSFAVIAVLFVGVYLLFFQSTLKKSPEIINSQFNDTQSGIVNKKDTMPGKEIANDLQIGSNNGSQLNDPSQPPKSYTETDIMPVTPPDIKNQQPPSTGKDEILKQTEVKPSIDSKSNRNESEQEKSPSKNEGKINNVQPPSQKEKNDLSRGVAPLIKESPKTEEPQKKSDKGSEADDKNKLTKDVTKETLENLQKNINDKLVKDKDIKKNFDEPPADTKKKNDGNKTDTTKKKTDNNTPIQAPKDKLKEPAREKTKDKPKEKPKDPPPPKDTNKETKKSNNNNN